MITMYNFILNDPYVKIVLIKNQTVLSHEAIETSFSPATPRQAMLYSNWTKTQILSAVWGLCEIVLSMFPQTLRSWWKIWKKKSLKYTQSLLKNNCRLKAPKTVWAQLQNENYQNHSK